VPAPEPALSAPARVVPSLLTSPWRHQEAAFKFCLDKFAAGLRGLLLAMMMGTGKTLVAIMLLTWLKAQRVMIVPPKRVIQVWVAELEQRLGIPVVVVALDDEIGSVAKKRERAEEKLKLAEARGVPFIAIINYESVWREPFASWAEKQTWDLVIADECHRIKAPGGKASLFFKRVAKRALYRIGLSGTPMPHGHTDLYAIFRFLDISIFGPSFNAFKQNYCVMGGYQRKQIVAPKNMEDFHARMNRITFRVGKDVLDLPPQTHVAYTCELGGEAARVYKDLEEDFVARVLDGQVTAANAMVKLLRLQQVTGGWVKTDDGHYRRIDSAKQKLLEDTLEDIGGEEPVVVFCRFHADLDAVHEAAKSLGYSSLELSGRRDELKAWQDGQGQVLAVQISAGGVGVDLTRARYSAYYSLSFSLGEYDQALSRVHRPGQGRPVEHIHLVARGTVDEKILRALEKRAEVVEAILAEIKNS
jgi:SNF2 family DNA or RNA helicase